MERNKVEKNYQIAREMYAELGVDTSKILHELQSIALSIHCWQGDDVNGFETRKEGILGGGIATTGSYPGRARTADQLKQDLEKMYSLLPGKHRLALHMSYGDFRGRYVDRNQIRPEHFNGWLEWGRENDVMLDMNSTYFSHPMAETGFTLSSKNVDIRKFWIEHAKCTREASAYIGRRQGRACMHNLWIPDGMKDHPVDRMGYRSMLLESLEEIFSTDFPAAEMKDSLEGKLFGIGSEAFVVGSHEFYLLYAAKRGKMITLDSGHFHPTEFMADKISSVLLFLDEILIHVSRGMRWDSDHVVILNDDSRSIFEEIVWSGKIEKVHIGLDYFDASINRVGAWTVGSRSALKAILLALLQPATSLKEYESSGNYFARMQLFELFKSLPFGAVWDYYCLSRDVPMESEVLQLIQDYDASVTRTR